MESMGPWGNGVKKTETRGVAKWCTSEETKRWLEQNKVARSALDHDGQWARLVKLGRHQIQ
jgi:hypothetical protein